MNTHSFQLLLKDRLQELRRVAVVTESFRDTLNEAFEVVQVVTSRIFAGSFAKSFDGFETVDEVMNDCVELISI